MPEDKDFKRLVRDRMAETGEPYTKARAELRPDDASAMPGESVSAPGPVTEVYRRAVDDPDFAAQLLADPEGAGREMGLTGSDLAELVGSQRFAAAGKQRGRRTLQIRSDIARHGQGEPWPFGDLSTAELAERASSAEILATQLQASSAMGIDQRSSPFAELIEWATALGNEIRRRSDASDAVDTALADALIQAINLVHVARRLAPQRHPENGPEDAHLATPGD